MRRFLPTFLLLLATLSCSADGWRDFPFKGGNLPDPPQQGAAWTPPKSGIPAPVVDAFAEMFKQGLPDPRGCEYRAVEVSPVAEALGAPQNDKIHGWVYTDKGGGKFVITLDGLIKPVIAAGEPADLHADIAALIDADQKEIDTEKKQAASQAAANPNAQPWTPSRSMWGYGGRGMYWGWGEETRQRMTAPGAALLLILGENDLASKYWAQWSSIPDQADVKAPYRIYAAGWIYAMQEQMNAAFIAGDDHLSAALGHRLITMRKAFDAAAPQAAANSRAPADAYSTPKYFAQLLAEVERRAAEPAYTPLFVAPGTAHGPERIKLLIRDLEEARPGLISNGYPSVTTDDSTVAALVKEGDAAVEPLLDCYEKDTRLIRTFGSGNMSAELYMLGVNDVAYTALRAILKTDFYDQYRERGLTRDQIAARIRDYLKKYSGLSQAERWYTVLCDENADPSRWMEAVNGIVFPASMEKNFAPGQTNWNPVKPGENPALLGDPLRGKSSPSVTDLLLKYLHSTQKQLEGQLDHDAWNGLLARYQLLARALAVWDGRGHLDELRKASEICRQNDSSIEFRSWLYERRDALGDTHALEEYAAWLADTGPGDFDWHGGAAHFHEFGSAFEPVWSHPDSPAIQKAIATMFSAHGSWSPLWTPDRTSATDLIYSPLAGFAGFQQELLRGLGDKSAALSVTVKDASIYLNIRRGGESVGIDKSDPLLPPPGKQVDCRVCDVYAFYLADLPGAPECQFYWPEAKRDEAVAACIKYIENYGANLRGSPDDRFAMPMGEVPHAGIYFPTLDHPATENDVKQHRAIFALDGERRVLKMPAFPITAYWSPHGIGPAVLREKHGWPHSSDNVAIGTVWQAEEQLVDGKWERWFGFAGAGRVARVPASELEFILKDDPNPDNRGGEDNGLWSLNMWRAWEGGIDTLIGNPDARWETRGGFGFSQNTHPNFINAPAGKTVVTFSLRNRTTADISIPGAFFQDDSNRKQLPPALKVTLASAEITPAWPDLTKSFDLEKIPWKEIPIRDGSAAKDDPAAKPADPVIIGPAGERTVFQIDLRDFFAMPAHAFFKLALSYAIPGHGPEHTESCEFLIGQPPWEEASTGTAAPGKPGGILKP